MTQNRMNNLFLIHVHKEYTDSLDLKSITLIGLLLIVQYGALYFLQCSYVTKTMNSLFSQ